MASPNPPTISRKLPCRCGQMSPETTPLVAFLGHVPDLREDVGRELGGGDDPDRDQGRGFENHDHENSKRLILRLSLFTSAAARGVAEDGLPGGVGRIVHGDPPVQAVGPVQAPGRLGRRSGFGRRPDRWVLLTLESQTKCRRNSWPVSRFRLRGDHGRWNSGNARAPGHAGVPARIPRTCRSRETPALPGRTDSDGAAIRLRPRPPLSYPSLAMAAKLWSMSSSVVNCFLM